MVIPWSHSQYPRHGCRGYGWGRQWRQSGSLWFTNIVIVASINCPLELWAKIYAIRLGLFEAAYYQHVGESSWLIPGREYGSPEDYFRGISCFIQEFVSELVFSVDSMPCLTTCDYPVSIIGPESSSSFKPTVVAPTLQVLLKQSRQTLRKCGTAQRNHRSWWTRAWEAILILSSNPCRTYCWFLITTNAARVHFDSDL